MAGEDRFEVHEGVGEGREVEDLFPSVIFFVAAVSMGRCGDCLPKTATARKRCGALK